MSKSTASFWAVFTVLTCAVFLFAGNGLFQTLVPIRAGLEGFSPTTIGFLGTAYFGGFAVGCFFGPKLIMSVGHIRAFTGLTAALTATALAFPLWVDPLFWGGLRVVTGICLAVLYIVVESWLNDCSTNTNRGRILSIYIIVTNIVTMAGQLMVNLHDATSTILFILLAMLLCLSIVPLSLSPIRSPKPIPSARLDLRNLFVVSPVGLIGCLMAGVVEGAFWSLGPVFAQARQMATSEIALIMATFVLGGTLSQWPLGWLSDKIDRRRVIAGLSFGTVITGLMIGFGIAPAGTPTYALACLHGALMIPIYPLCMSHANDNVPNSKMVETSGGLLLAYSLGATAGPLAASFAMAKGDAGGLFMFIGAMLFTLGLYVVWRVWLDPVEHVVERSDFTPVSPTSPSVYALDEE